MWVVLDAGWGRVDGLCGSGPHTRGSASTPHFFRCGFNAGRAGGLEAGRRRMWVGTTSKWICLHATFFSMWVQYGSGRWVGGGSTGDEGWARCGLGAGRRPMWVGTTSKWICLHANFFSTCPKCGSGRWVGGESSLVVGSMYRSILCFGDKK